MKRSVYCSFFLYDWYDLAYARTRRLIALFDGRLHERPRLASPWLRQSFDDGSARATGGMREPLYEPPLATSVGVETYDMECIDRIRELNACVLLFSTCLLHRLRGLAMAFLRTQMRLRHKVRKREGLG